MIFRADSIDLILKGKKTQTRRPVQGWDRFKRPTDWVHNMPVPCVTVHSVHMAKPRRIRLKWEVGRTYAVCPGRGEREVARILLKRLECQRLGSITRLEAMAEGLSVVSEAKPGCNGVYRYGYDSKKGYDTMWQARGIEDAYIEMLQTMYKKLENNDLVWVLEFQLVK